MSLALLTLTLAYFRWVGVVGHTLYGDVDIGMCNIDITYSRYQVVDFSAWVR